MADEDIRLLTSRLGATSTIVLIKINPRAVNQAVYADIKRPRGRKLFEGGLWFRYAGTLYASKDPTCAT
jgi:hypothetical protein